MQQARPYTKLVSNTMYVIGADPGFKVRGAPLNKSRLAEEGATICVVFRVKNHDFTQTNHILFPILGGGARRVRPPPLDPPLRNKFILHLSINKFYTK